MISFIKIYKLIQILYKNVDFFIRYQSLFFSVERKSKFCCESSKHLLLARFICTRSYFSVLTFFLEKKKFDKYEQKKTRVWVVFNEKGSKYMCLLNLKSRTREREWVKTNKRDVQTFFFYLSQLISSSMKMSLTFQYLFTNNKREKHW